MTNDRPENPQKKVLLPFPGFPLEAVRGLSSQIPVAGGGDRQGAELAERPSDPLRSNSEERVWEIS
ncbi:MAG: hypothetical protein MZU91_11240 [Desulfosudis oleivorans]|nr:hypothetical protein [Desulfosudis oleivorans]